MSQISPSDCWGALRYLRQALFLAFFSHHSSLHFAFFAPLRPGERSPPQTPITTKFQLDHPSIQPLAVRPPQKTREPPATLKPNRHRSEPRKGSPHEPLCTVQIQQRLAARPQPEPPVGSGPRYPVPFSTSTVIIAARLAANRANAQHSTGPKTDEGKAKIARNALKHGLDSKEIFIAPGEQETFDQFQTDLAAEINPVGALEQDLFRQLLHAAWNLRRIRIQETEVHEKASAPMINPFLDDKFSAALDRLAKHQVRIERTYHRALRELRSLQTNRHLANRLLLRRDLPGNPPALADFRKSPEQSQHAAEQLRYTLAIAERYAGSGLDFHQIVEQELKTSGRPD